MIDMHCHILNGIDDGSKSAGQSLNMLKIAQDEEIDTIVATPHLLELKDIEKFKVNRDNAIKDIEDEIKKNNINIKLIKGAEVYINPFIYKCNDLKSVCINNGSYMLMELPMLSMPSYVGDVIYNLKLKGINTIIAHPERYKYVAEDPNIIYGLIEQGALMQVNTGSITGIFGKSIQKTARILFEHNMVHMVGTDAHTDRTRSPRIKEAIRFVGNWSDKDVIERIIHKTPEKVLTGDLIDIEEPAKYKKHKFWFI